MGGSKKLTANDVWSASKSAEIFEESIKKLYPRFIEAQAKSEVLSFDKVA
jgi:hypothetical protein